ncbi:hypothetical protein BU23DRAFT_598182 [Bimuria novae-zelandiae CBS 107.79]|uniref:Uncharacterized protein n=1 Tax=Bimuria novae-zelandiae CBS 107.79 TaxID=1447943 RepID=A0A6A5VNJ7_9PLEO|nr:hypothetical protein BU23DRAFT_598182 [Bimuria novae-zelandiae CBS 107.79]
MQDQVSIGIHPVLTNAMGTLLARVKNVLPGLEEREAPASASTPVHASATVHTQTISPAIIAATEKGMLCENACAGEWAVAPSPPSEGGEGTGKEAEVEQGEEGEKRGSWDGFGEDGARHVRWKGTDA